MYHISQTLVFSCAGTDHQGVLKSGILLGSFDMCIGEKKVFTVSYFLLTVVL